MERSTDALTHSVVGRPNLRCFDLGTRRWNQERSSRGFRDNDHFILNKTEELKVIRDSLSTVLEQQCNDLKKHIASRGRFSILASLRTQLARRLDNVRDAHLNYNRAHYEDNQPLVDAYSYIVRHEIACRDIFSLIDNYVHGRYLPSVSITVEDPVTENWEEEEPRSSREDSGQRSSLNPSQPTEVI